MPTQSQVQKQKSDQGKQIQGQNAQDLEQQRRQQQEQERIRREEELVRLRQQNEFWNGSEDVHETIPEHGEIAFAKMECAYKDVHGEKMGLKQRMSRSPKQANKKRARATTLKEGRNLYHRALNYAASKYQIDRKLPWQLEGDEVPETEEQRFQTFYSSNFKDWLDLTNTEEGNVFNDKMMRHLSGDFLAQNEIAMEILHKFDAWDLDRYSNLDDEQIAENYADIRDKVTKAESARSILRAMLKSGADLDENFVSDILAKCTYFEELKRVVDAKAELMDNIYYALLRKSDMENLTDEQLRQKVESNDFVVQRPKRSQKTGKVERDNGTVRTTTEYNRKLAQYTATLRAVRSLQNTRNALKNPAAFLAAAKQKQETEAKQNEKLDLKTQVQDAKKRFAQRVQQDESERRRAFREKLSEYETRYNRSMAQADDSSQLSDLRKEKPQLRAALRGWLNLSETEQAAAENKALVDKFRGDENIQLKEIGRMLTEYDEIDLKQYEKLTPELIGKKYVEMKTLFAKNETIKMLLQHYLTYGGELDQTAKNRLLIKASYLENVERVVNLWMAVLTDSHYDGEGMKKFCRYTDKELRKMHDQQTDPGLKDYYLKVHQLIRNLRQPVNSWDAFLKQGLQKNNVIFTDLHVIRKRYEQEQQDPEQAERAAALEHRRAQMEAAVKIQLKVEGERTCRSLIAHEVPGYDKVERVVKCHIEYTGMTDEQIRMRVRNLASPNPEERYQEYDRIFDQVLNIDLSQFHDLDSDEGLLRQAEQLMVDGNPYIQIWGLVKHALSDGMQIPLERKQQLWKRYSFLISLTTLVKARLNCIASEGYGDLLPEEEPKDYQAVQAEIEASAKEKSARGNFMVKLAVVLQEKNKDNDKNPDNRSGIDLTKPLDKQYETFIPKEKMPQ